MPVAASANSRRSRLRQVILAGFAAIFLLVLLSAAMQLRQVGEFPQLIEAGRVATQKMEIITALIEVARSRTRMTNQMIVTSDPFDKDALRMRLDEEAARFALLREQFVAMGLTEQEQDLLRRNGQFVRPTLRAQRRAAELALSEDPAVLREAQRLLMFEVFPMQGKIVDNFMQIAQIQRATVQAATLQAQARYQQMVYLMIGLTGGSLMLILLVAVYVVRRTALTETALHREKERAQVTLRSIGDAVVATDAVGRVQYMNPAAELLIGRQLEQVVRRPIGEVLDARDANNGRVIADYVMQLVQHGNPGEPSDDVVLHNARGERLSIALTLARIREVDGRIGGVILSFQDVTESRQLAKRIEFHAQHDALTGLLNRRAFEERVNQALAIYDQGVHVLCAMDLDRFKLVNDSCGHAAGDELLRQLTGRLRSVVRKGDLIARMGGDEFAFFLLNTDLRHAAELADKLLDAVREFRFLWQGKTFRVGASIGLVASPADSPVDFQHLLRAADAACYQAKADGRDRAVVVPYDGASLEAQRQEGEWVSKINEALERGGLELVGQPILALAADPPPADFLEVLVRLRDGGISVAPMSFLPAAERYNLMPRIDEWVVREVLRILAQDPHGARRYAVNLSGQSIGDPGFVQRVVQLIERSGVDRGRLCFELTETAAIASLDTAQHFMNVARGMGCQVALDDFGSGLSSFGYIKNLPVDLIKIDGEFIRQLASDKTSRVMVEAIHGVAQALGLRTVAEFVGDAETLEILRSIGVDMAQGYYLGKPVPLDDAPPVLASGQA